MRTPLVPLAFLVMSLTATPAHASDAPAGTYRFKLGDFEVVALKDAESRRPLDKLIANPEEIPKAGVTPEDPTTLRVNAFLVDTGKELVMVDTGNGGSVGRTVANLEAAGYAPERIGTVLLTHLHGDHVGGMIADGKPTFPKAQVFVARREAEFWIDPEREKTDARKAGMQKARESLAPYEEAGRLTRFDGAREIVPGITAVPAYGHTPGHTAFMLESRGEKLLVWGDIVHVQQLQLPNPNVSLVFDVDADAARDTRKAVLARAAAEGYPVAGMHMAWPGIGHIRKSGDGYAWEAVR